MRGETVPYCGFQSRPIGLFGTVRTEPLRIVAAKEEPEP